MSKDKTESSSRQRRRRGTSPSNIRPEKSGGINGIPRWLRDEKGLPDLVAGSVVIVAGGILFTVLVGLLVVIFPAGG